jgi:hypothetical protein
MKKLLLLFTILFLLLTPKAFASLGVGVGVGKIQVDENLKPGQIYNLPQITVLNTGDQPSDYEVVIEHQEKQPELIPQSDWLIFTPKSFHLDPKKVQKVNVRLNLPIKTTPGKYFVYLEAHPLKKTAAGNTSVNIAAATKLNFTVVPANIFEALYYKLLSMWNIYYPWPQIITVGIILFVLLLIIKRFINVEIKPTKRGIPMWLIAVGVAVFILAYLIFWLKFFKAF